MAAPDPSSASDPDDLVRHGRFVKALARDLARDDSEADELAARTMAEAIARRPGGGPSLRAWLRRVLWRIFQRERRDEERRRRHARSSLEVSGGAGSAVPAVVDLVARIELEQAIATAFADLEEPYKSTLFLRYFDDLSPTQIAARSATPIETVKTRLKRGLERLRARLDARANERGAARGGWRATAIALAGRGGLSIAFTKTKSLIAAAVVVLLAGAAAWKLAKCPFVSRRVEPMTSALAVSARTAATVQPNGVDRAPATSSAATRTTEALPFASGIVVDAEGVPLADVRLTPSLVYHLDNDKWLASNVDLETVERDTLATSGPDGSFRLATAPRNVAGLFFYKPGFAIGEWFDLSSRHEQNQGHRVVLAAAAQVHGRVVDSSRRPIRRAYVKVVPKVSDGNTIVAAAADGAPSCLREVPWSARSLLTGEDGRFSIDCVNDVPCWVWFGAGGYGPFPVQRELVLRDTEFEIVLERRSAALLDVRDAKTKQPVARPRALLFDEIDTHARDLCLPYDEWLTEAVSRPRVWSAPNRLPIWCEGELSALKRAGETRSLKLVVFAEGYRPLDHVVVLSQGEEAPHEIIELEPREPVATLSGTVTGAPNASLELRFDPPFVTGHDTLNSRPFAKRFVGADGHFAFHDLPPATYRLAATSQGLTPITLDLTTPRDDVSIRFAPAARLVAHVVDREKAPIAGQMVQLQTLDGARAWSAATDGDGDARFEELPTGTLDVISFPPDRYRRAGAPTYAFGEGIFLSDERVTLVSGENGPIELPSLERRSVTLAFRFPDGSGAPGVKINQLFPEPDGGPVAAAFRESDRLRGLALETAVDGRVDVDLYPGSYELVAAVGSNQCRKTFVVPRRCEDGIVVTLPDVRRVGSVCGRLVTTPGGRPLAGWSVVAIVTGTGSADSVSTNAVTTDADGRFRIDHCPIGPLYVSARDPASDDDDRPVLDRVSEAHLRVDLGSDREKQITIQVPRPDTTAVATAELDLEVTSADGGRPIPRVQVLVDGTIGDAEFHLLRRSLPTDEEGRLRQRLLSCARYRVRLFPPGDRGDGKTPWKPLDVDVVPVDGVIRVRAALERAER